MAGNYQGGRYGNNPFATPYTPQPVVVTKSPTLGDVVFSKKSETNIKATLVLAITTVIIAGFIFIFVAVGKSKLKKHSGTNTKSGAATPAP